MSTQVPLVTGSDGQVPIYEPLRRWAQWNINQIYMGTVGAGKYIPNPGDLIVDLAFWKWYIVDSIDPTTGLATYTQANPPADPGGFTTDDILLGPGPGTQADTYLAYVDQSVMPFTLAVDARCKIGGSLAQSAMIFINGLDNPQSKVISTFYDEKGNLLGNSVPLELCTMATGTNYTEKTVVTCATMEALKNGEILTVVFYSADGHVVSTRQLMVYNTAFIRTTDTSTKYVTSISLKSPQLSPSDPKLILYPLNLPLRGLNLVGVVNYSDGSSLEMPIDNNGKFSIFGLNAFVGTVVGQELPLVLNYSLSPGEIAYGVTTGETNSISSSYRAITTAYGGAYTLKLFCYPVWIDALNGYRLEWFLYNLNRQAVYKVTPWVQIGASSRSFNPTAYGINQELTVNVNLNQVDTTLPDFLFTQTLQIVLACTGDLFQTNWTVQYSPSQNPVYGTNIFANCNFVNYNYWTLDVSSGFTAQADWLQALYYNSQPLYDPTKEPGPVVPNMFAIVFGNQRVECLLTQWNVQQIVGNGLINHDTMYIEFFKRTNNNDLQLAIAGLPVRQLS